MPPRISEELKQKIIELKLQKAMKSKDIATELGISINTVHHVIQKTDIPKEVRSKCYQKFDDAFVQNALNLVEFYKGYDEAAIKLGITKSKLMTLLRRRLNFRLNEEQINIARATYSMELKAIVRAKYSSGATWRELTHEFGLKRSVIKTLVSGINKKLTKLKTQYNSYYDRLNSFVKNKNSILLSAYVDSKTDVEIKCEKGHIFKMPPADMFGGHWCSSCVHHTSSDERLMETFLNQFCNDIKKGRGVLQNKKYEIDLYSESKRIGIELCGQYFHREGYNYKNKTKHYEKFKQAEQSGIRLITIFDSELRNRPNQISGFLASVFGRFDRIVGARETFARIINPSEAFRFCEENHIQGGVLVSINYGLFFNNELVAVCCFVKRKDSIFELVRYCLPPGLAIRGGLKKLIATFLKNNNCSELYSFSDNRWSGGSVYINNGFKLVSEQKPSYYYFRIGRHELLHKFNFRKDRIEKKLGPLLPGETEWEAMQRFRYDRVWDCGKKKWVLDLNK